jgi:hypothetical protein
MWKLSLILLLAVPAVAQSPYPTAEVFAGFSEVRSGGVYFPGWTTDIAANFNQDVGVVFDFTDVSKTLNFSQLGKVGTSGQYFMAGPRFSIRRKRVTVFTNILGGGVRAGVGFQGLTLSETAYGMDLGGGVDVNLSKHVAIRIAQVDVVEGRVQGNWGTDFRSAAGIVFTFGGK